MLQVVFVQFCLPPIDKLNKKPKTAPENPDLVGGNPAVVTLEYLAVPELRACVTKCQHVRHSAVQVELCVNELPPYGGM